MGLEREKWPVLVRVGLAGLSGRRSALGFAFVTAAVAAGVLAFCWDDSDLYPIVGLLAAASVWFFGCVWWVDRYGIWHNPRSPRARPLPHRVSTSAG